VNEPRASSPSSDDSSAAVPIPALACIDLRLPAQTSPMVFSGHLAPRGPFAAEAKPSSSPKATTFSRRSLATPPISATRPSLRQPAARPSANLRTTAPKSTGSFSPSPSSHSPAPVPGPKSQSKPSHPHHLRHRLECRNRLAPQIRSGGSRPSRETTDSPRLSSPGPPNSRSSSFRIESCLIPAYNFAYISLFSPLPVDTLSHRMVFTI
jgi:hypothetical protein